LFSSYKLKDDFIEKRRLIEMRSKILFVALIVLCVTAAFSFEKVKDLSLSADGIEKLKIDCGSGFLKVTGNNSLRIIEVKAEIIVKGKNDEDAEEYIRKNVVLTLEKKGSNAVLVSQFKNSIFTGSRVIDLTVEVPKNINIDVDDGSGFMTIENIDGTIYVDDGSGDLTVEQIQGDVRIDDGSGTVDVNNVRGNVFVDDSSGTIDVQDVTGNVVVDDGSGSIRIEGVGGDVHIKDDGSGSLSIRDVKGKVIK
jgi:hypothetical protein